MIQEKKFHANPAMIRKLYDKFGPTSQVFRLENDNFQFHIMKFYVTTRIIDSLIQQIRNAYNSNVNIDYKGSSQDKNNLKPDIKKIISNFKEVDNLITYYSKANNNEQVQKVLSFLNQIKSAHDNFKQKNLEFLVFVRNIFKCSCQSLKKTLNDRLEIGLCFDEKFTFYDKLYKSIQEQLNTAYIYVDELEKIIYLNETDIQDYKLDDIEEEDQESIIEIFVKAFKSNLT